jgi:hypothetical protein
LNRVTKLGFALVLFGVVSGHCNSSDPTQKPHFPEDRIPFLESYARRSPRQRVEIWRQSLFSNKLSPVQGDIEDILIIQGTNAAPEIAKFVREGKGYLRFRSILLLSRMDGFIPASQLPLPQVARSVSSPVLTERGLVGKPFTGQRIGKEANEAIEWAATQTVDHELQQEAKESSGLIGSEWRHRGLDEVVKAWSDGGWPGLRVILKFGCPALRCWEGGAFVRIPFHRFNSRDRFTPSQISVGVE